MKINCISCGFKIELDDCYDDYDGPIKCYVCETVINVKTVDGSVKYVGFVKPVSQCQAEPSV